MSLYNLARMETATTGTGIVTLLNAVAGFISFADAGVADGATVTYAIEDGFVNGVAQSREIGRGVYTAASKTLTRSVLKSTNGSGALNLTGNAHVFITAAAEDFTSNPSSSFYVLGKGANQVVPADTNEATLATVTIPANTMGPTGQLRIWTMWQVTGSTNNKVVRVYFGNGLSGTKYLELTLVGATIVFDATVTQIFNQGVTNSQVGSPSATPPAGLGAGTGAVITSSVDTTVVQTITITGQKATGGETLKLVGYTVEIAYGA